MPITSKQLRERDAKQDIGAEMLQSIREMKTDKGRVVAKIATSQANEAHTMLGQTQLVRSSTRNSKEHH